MPNIVELLNRLNESQDINIKCETMEQLKVLKHLQDNFNPSGIKKLKLVRSGIRLTDCNGKQADFIYNKKLGSIELHEC